MRVITASVIALLTYCAIMPVSSGSLPMANSASPSIVNLARRQEIPIDVPTPIPTGSSAPAAEVNSIVTKYPELSGLHSTLIYFAFCSQTNDQSCAAYYEEARNQFWTMLVDQDLPEENKKGIDLLIEQGDATYVRLLFADGTIFCRNSDGTYTNYIEKFVNQSPRSSYTHLWGRATTYSQANFNSFLQKYFARFQFDQEIKDLDKVDNTEATKGYTACYDVTMRDGLDAVIKWSIATVYSGYLQPILEALKPQSRFYNFMLGSLHDSILVNNTDIMNILTNWVDCTKVEKSYQYYCSEIQNAIKGNKTSGIQLKPTLIDPDYVSYHGNQDTDSKIDNIRNFNRQTIDLVRLLDH